MFILLGLSFITKWPVEPDEEEINLEDLSTPEMPVETLSSTLGRRSVVENRLRRIGSLRVAVEDGSEKFDGKQISILFFMSIPLNGIPNTPQRADPCSLHWTHPERLSPSMLPEKPLGRSLTVEDAPLTRKRSIVQRIRSISHGQSNAIRPIVVEASPSTTLTESTVTALQQGGEIPLLNKQQPRGRSKSFTHHSVRPQRSLTLNQLARHNSARQNTFAGNVAVFPELVDDVARIRSPSITSLASAVTFVLPDDCSLPTPTSVDTTPDSPLTPFPARAARRDFTWSSAFLDRLSTPSRESLSSSERSSTPESGRSSPTIVVESVPSSLNLDGEERARKVKANKSLAELTSWSAGTGDWTGYEGMRHACIIASHNSSEVLAITLPSLLRIISPRSIFIADNGSSQEEIAATRALAERLTAEYNATHPDYARVSGKGINVGVLREGSKNLAQFSVLNSLAYLGSQIEFVTLLDDDTFLPDNWSELHILNLFHKNPTTHCYAYPILASSSTHSTLLQHFQNHEYLVSMFMKVAQARLSTTFFPSGCISTWRAHILLDVLSRHDTMFRGDDLQMGLILHSMYGEGSFLNPFEVHKGDYRIGVAPWCVGTVVPTCVLHGRDLFPRMMWKHFTPCSCGEPSLFYQRARSWEVARHRFLPKFWNMAIHRQKLSHWHTWFAKLCALDCVVGIVNDFVIIAIAILSGVLLGGLKSMGILAICCIAIQNLIFTIVHLLVFARTPPIRPAPSDPLNPSTTEPQTPPLLHVPPEITVLYPLLYSLPLNLILKHSAMLYNYLHYAPFVRSSPRVSSRARRGQLGVMDVSWGTQQDGVGGVDAARKVARALKKKRGGVVVDVRN
ncbi:hypothetical protein HDV00_010184 [Rhizophlyctis rosea]|nr:hypothetical protein HDV00_010184 [Rhizophlyctis rosea]